MKALTLTQPWATLVACGAKRWETRSWGTGFRGLLAIHAGKGFPRDARELCSESPFHEALERAGFEPARDLPTGAVVAVARLVSVRPTLPQLVAELGEQELAFGNYAPGRAMWLLEDVVELPVPIPCRGALSIWDLPVDVEAEAHRTLQLRGFA